MVYETFCITCNEKEKRGKEEREIYSITCEQLNKQVTNAEKDERKRKRSTDRLKTESKEKKKMKEKKEYTVKYIGETGRSAYERGAEHMSDFWNYDEKSHLLKHFLSCHKDMKMSEVKFGMKVRNTFKSALERQVGEAVAIDMEQRKGMKLMNSKSEYNRCTVPRICTRSERERKEESEKMEEEEKRLKCVIKWMKKCNGRKRRKVDDNENNEKNAKGDKNEKNDEFEGKRRKLRINDENEVKENDEKVEINVDDEKGEVVRKSENCVNTVNEKIEIVMLQKIATENEKSPKKSQESPKNSKIGSSTPKLGNYYGDKNTDLNGPKNQKTESDTQDTPPAVGTNEVPGLEERNYLEIVKSPEKKEKPTPLPPAAGTIEVPGLEDLNILELVKSPKVKKIPPAAGTFEVPGLEELINLEAVKSPKVKLHPHHPPTKAPPPPVVGTVGLPDLEEGKV